MSVSLNVLSASVSKRFSSRKLMLAGAGSLLLASAAFATAAPLSQQQADFTKRVQHVRDIAAQSKIPFSHAGQQLDDFSNFNNWGNWENV